MKEFWIERQKKFKKETKQQKAARARQDINKFEPPKKRGKK
jgi:hypothetical protein